MEIDKYNSVKTIDKNKKKNIKNIKSKDNKYRKYLDDLERKSNTPVDVNTLSL